MSSVFKDNKEKCYKKIKVMGGVNKLKYDFLQA